MSVSSLPEWKQLLLERKRREEEERERREKEEEEKLASMPAWKRGIIQRRKAKQENVGDRERDKDISLLPVDLRSPPDALSDTDSSVTVNLGSDLSLSPDPGQWLDAAEPKPGSQVYLETIVPVHENPFIRTQSSWRKGREADVGNELEVKEKPSPRCQDAEPARGRDIELKIERFMDLTQGWDKEKSRDRSLGRENAREGPEKEKKQQKEFVKDAPREQEKEIHLPPGPFPPSGPCLRTIRADNIIIIEQDKGGGDEQRGRPEEDQQGKRGMKMDLREILAGGGSVTEIRASEVLIIKPSASPEERAQGGKGREDRDVKSSVESLGRELRSDMSWLRDKEKERPWGQATVINKDDRKDSSDDCVFVERGGRVSQLLSKFGQHPKPPSRSKSSDNFLQPGWRKYSEDQDEQQSEERRSDGRNASLRTVPKRSFSFSDRVIGGGVENGDGRCYERTHSDRSAAPWADVAGTARLRLGCARFSDKDRFGKQRDVKTEEDKGGVMQNREGEMWKKHRSELKKVESMDKRAAGKVGDADGDRGFTVASVKNTEGVSFARRVTIRQDGRARADREVRLLAREKSLDKDSETEGQTEAHVGDKVLREDGSKTLPEGCDAGPASGDLPSPREAQHRHDSACNECSSLLCTAADQVHQRGAEWSGTGPQGPYLTYSVLSQQTENLISKIEKLGDTTVYLNERGERVYKAAPEVTRENQQEAQTGNLTHDATPRSPRRTAPIGIPQGPLEIQIPRSVFYVAEDVPERRKNERQSSDGQDGEAGQKVETRDSWKVGKPLSRIESLREKIRQRELEKQRQREARDGDGSEAAAAGDAQPGEDRYEQKGGEAAKQREAVAHMQTRPIEAEMGQEEAAEQTSMTARDVRREVSVLKTYPQLPVSVPHSQDDGGEEVTGESTAAASEVTSDRSQKPEDEDEPLKDVEEQLGRHRGQSESTEEEEEEDKGLSQEDAVSYTTPVESAQPLSSSPPLPSSLAAMSRIYNLNTVGSRSALCLRDRTVDVPSSLHLVKVKPLISSSQQGDIKALTGESVCGVQRQIDQFQLKEQEAPKSSTNTSSKDRETKGQQSPKGGLKQQKEEEESPKLKPKESPQRNSSQTPQPKQTITVTPSFVRSQSPDNTLKPTNCAPTPASSPSSSSPASSPSVSPSPSPSPKLFTIRSSSGAHVKRGATITVTPKKPAVAAAAPTVRPTPAEPAKGPSQQATPAADEPVKKRYPAVEEIEVIGGYQNLEKSCLVKNKVTPKRGKVCFDEDQLEQVCEYPSENSMLERSERLRGEDEGEGGGGVLLKSIKSVEITTEQRLRVGESFPR
ncbi:uncharacterized protein ppp1r18 isoform X2 [Kryptolebias marmoratus]|uniref:uncharacterized protein ppp1r18 isoform X2 n=1 Tax=Kryptolebias marmoratus TaxID=37003 RepID=UPI0007F879D8|nr:uncharacterized protein ppp1r18 isoform X2 [Kryptolebias marmoratus]